MSRGPTLTVLPVAMDRSHRTGCSHLARQSDFFPTRSRPGKHRRAHLEPPTKDSVGRDQLCPNIVMGTQFQSLVPASRPIGW